MRLRRALFPTAALFALIAFAMCGDRLERLGGQWAIGHVQTLPEAGGNQQRLYRLTGLTRIRVDDLVRQARYYAPDCVIYSAYRRTGSSTYFAVCGSRTPLAVGWTGYALDADGLRRVDTVWLASDRVRLHTQFIPIGTIRAAAERQPRYRRSWTDDPDHTRETRLPKLEVDTVRRVLP